MSNAKILRRKGGCDRNSGQEGWADGLLRPDGKNTVKQYTVYHDSKAVPDAVNRFLDAVPMARGLLVPLDKFKDTRVALENPKSSAGILFAAVKAALN